MGQNCPDFIDIQNRHGSRIIACGATARSVMLKNWT